METVKDPSVSLSVFYNNINNNNNKVYINYTGVSLANLQMLYVFRYVLYLDMGSMQHTVM